MQNGCAALCSWRQAFRSGGRSCPKNGAASESLPDIAIADYWTRTDTWKAIPMSQIMAWTLSNTIFCTAWLRADPQQLDAIPPPVAGRFRLFSAKDFLWREGALDINLHLFHCTSNYELDRNNKMRGVELLRSGTFQCDRHTRVSLWSSPQPSESKSSEDCPFESAN